MITKDIILRYAKVLLISNKQKDYEQLKKFGFMHIQRFKSDIEAGDYFEKHPEKLNEYQIVFERCNRIHGRGGNNHRFYNLLWTLDRQKSIRVEAETYFDDVEKSNKPKKKSNFYIDGKKVEAQDVITILNMVIKKIKDEKTCVLDIKNKTKLKEDLKVLYVYSATNSNDITDLTQVFGLNVDFLLDSEETSQQIEEKMDNYDIVIAPNTYGKVLNANRKKTTDSFSLLATYAFLPMSSKEKIGQDFLGKKICLHYSFYHGPEPEREIYEKFYPVVGHDSNNHLKSIISSVMSLYKDALLLKNGIDLSDCTFKNANQYESEYLEKKKEILESRQKQKKVIEDYDALVKTIADFVYYNYKAYENSLPRISEGLEVIVRQDGYFIANTHKGSFLGALVIPKQNKENLRVFSVQLATPKGKLLPEQQVGIYMPDYSGTESDPPNPSEPQISVIHSIESKVARVFPAYTEKAKRSLTGKQKNRKDTLSGYKRERKRKNQEFSDI